MQEGRIVRIEFQEEDGWHIVTSEDLPGLFLANRDFYKVYCAIPQALRIILEEQPDNEVAEKEKESTSMCTVGSTQNHWIAIPAQTWPRVSFQIGDPIRHELAHT